MTLTRGCAIDGSGRHGGVFVGDIAVGTSNLDPSLFAAEEGDSGGGDVDGPLIGLDSLEGDVEGEIIEETAGEGERGLHPA